MFSGMPIAFALGFVAILFMAVFMPASSLDTVTQNVYEEMASITLLVDSALHPQGRRDRTLGRRPRSLSRDARVDAAHPGRAGHRQRVHLRAVRRDGRIEPGDVLGDRQRGHPGDAQARLLAGLRGRHHRRGRHARHPAAAVDHDDPLRRRRRGVARPAVPRRHRTGTAAGRAVRARTRRGSSAGSTRPRASPSTATARTRTTSMQKTYTFHEKVEMLPRVVAVRRSC